MIGNPPFAESRFLFQNFPDAFMGSSLIKVPLQLLRIVPHPYRKTLNGTLIARFQNFPDAFMTEMSF